jgi:hypothetical protein
VVERLGGIDAAEATARLASATGRPYTLVRRLAGGSTGAHLVTGPDGPRVLKWEFDPVSKLGRRRGVALTERLRTEAGWPVPRQTLHDADDCLLILQELLPGAPVTRVDHPLVDQILDLHERRLAVVVDAGDPDAADITGEGPWPGPLLHTLTRGGRGYCRHDTLRAHDARTAALAARIERFGHELTAAPVDWPGGHIVHWDLHPENLLVDGGGLSAVVDTDFAVVADARVDLVVMALASHEHPCAPGVRDRLADLALGDLDDPVTQAYLAHVVLRVVDWSIRLDQPAERELWLDLADRYLRI